MFGFSARTAAESIIVRITKTFTESIISTLQNKMLSVEFSWELCRVFSKFDPLWCKNYALWLQIFNFFSSEIVWREGFIRKPFRYTTCALTTYSLHLQLVCKRVKMWLTNELVTIRLVVKIWLKFDNLPYKSTKKLWPAVFAQTFFFIIFLFFCGLPVGLLIVYLSWKLFFEGHLAWPPIIITLVSDWILFVWWWYCFTNWQ